VSEDDIVDRLILENPAGIVIQEKKKEENKESRASYFKRKLAERHKPLAAVHEEGAALRVGRSRGSVGGSVSSGSRPGSVNGQASVPGSPEKLVVTKVEEKTEEVVRETWVLAEYGGHCSALTFLAMIPCPQRTTTANAPTRRRDNLRGIHLHLLLRPTPALNPTFPFLRACKATRLGRPG
jgi:hypothetical protein